VLLRFSLHLQDSTQLTQMIFMHHGNSQVSFLSLLSERISSVLSNERSKHQGHLVLRVTG
jgi:hypothetical protein